MVRTNASRTRKVALLTLRLLLGAVFLYASYDKILHPNAFSQAVYNYQILPDAVVNVTALVLPWLELLLGLCLVAGWWLPGATALSTGLLAVFIGALVFNHVRGLDIHCGCFSTEETDKPADLWTVARDVSFLLIALHLTASVYLTGRRSPNRSAANQPDPSAVAMKKEMPEQKGKAGW